MLLFTKFTLICVLYTQRMITLHTYSGYNLNRNITFRTILNNILSCFRRTFSWLCRQLNFFIITNFILIESRRSQGAGHTFLKGELLENHFHVEFRTSSVMADSRIMSLGWPRGVIRFKINIPFKSEVSDTSDDEAPDGVKVIQLVNLQLLLLLGHLQQRTRSTLPGPPNTR